MKVKVISRSTDEFTRERSHDLQRVFRNFDPSLRPQEKAVEYVRAVNAAKLDKMFAKPFIGAMDGHMDAVSCMAKNPNHLKGIFSGSMDGDIRLWDIANRRTVCQFPGHQGAVRGLTASTDGRILISCGTDCTVRLWNVPFPTLNSYETSNNASEPLAVYVWKNAFWAVDHQWDGNLFATAGAQLDIWDHNRSQPVSSYEWGTDSVISVRFNPGEPNVLATSASDRSIALYDLRMSSPARKVIMRTKTNSICWNPREPMNFTAANEDCNCYSYDSRKLDEAKCVHRDHVSAVMDIDFSPSGREFVTGSYDRTIRIFPYNGGHSREIYHTKRMQRVFCVRFSSDASYVISGSDDTNLRLWKAKASEQLGVLLPREKRKHEYQEAVKNRYKHLPEVKRIVRHRHLPKPIFKAAALRRTIMDAERRKEERRKAHSTPGSISTVPLRIAGACKIVGIGWFLRPRFEPNCDVLLRRIVLQLLKEFSLKGDEAPFSLRKENPMSHASWIPPTVGVWKLNINASWLDNVGASGVGWVVLDLLSDIPFLFVAEFDCFDHVSVIGLSVVNLYKMIGRFLIPPLLLVGKVLGMGLRFGSTRFSVTL
ncbi:DDB1- and CUL4-associated factor 13 [Cucumis melo var. makuwa]|uniref:DDB1- and CUL4-associated factor 13 n=1 Tax=Cucumis melo var. makuwa TaxID=1194695 RepID=A0A5D3DDM7_CUCMM|nr:DDB1- and CUL4-associated factor 13 [Cucumis melo var. makuwa]